MLYWIEKCSPLEIELLTTNGPYFDFRYSRTKGYYEWKDTHIIENDRHYYPLRQYAFSQLRSGLVCLDWELAKNTWAYLEKPESEFNQIILKDYPLLKEYAAHNPHYKSDYIALAVSEFIKEYAAEASTLRYIDFDSYFKLKNLSKYEPKRLDRL